MEKRLEYYFLSLVCLCLLFGHACRVSAEPARKQQPWVTPADRPYNPTQGLEEEVIVVSSSHGRFYNSKIENWVWQRPPLYTSIEDLLTQSIVTQYYVPMLEKAGATVYTSRERDPGIGAVLRNGNGYGWTKDIIDGYPVYLAPTTTDSSKIEYFTWFNKKVYGEYGAVYVQYPKVAASIQHAEYTVCHAGGKTKFIVNQSIGSGIWVYLGTFQFGNDKEHCQVILSNRSKDKGSVIAGNVRIGGGFSKGYANYYYCALYNAQRNLAPDSVVMHYPTKKEEYRNDIWSRPLMTNYLYKNNIPVDMMISLHTDAGARKSDSLIGTLGIVSTSYNPKDLANGEKRNKAEKLAKLVTEGVSRDLTKLTGRQWSDRGVRDADYCESREADVPAMLVELFSHQNFWDVRYAQHPVFRFVLARSLYNSTLSFLSGRKKHTLQPLPVTDFAVMQNAAPGRLELSWQPAKDTIFSSAAPTGYIVYTKKDNGGFDNGTFVNKNTYTFTPQKNHLYSFYVTAVNKGGESFPSEVLCARISSSLDAKNILIVNAFTRLSGPEQICADSIVGFDILSDPGVDYMQNRILSGIQMDYRRAPVDSGPVTEDIGHSRIDMDGEIFAGNTFDYPSVHARMFIAHGDYNIVSASIAAFQKRKVNPQPLYITDIICGAQKYTPWDRLVGCDYTLFTQETVDALNRCLDTGDSKFIISGAFIGKEILGSKDSRLLATRIGIDTVNNSYVVRDSKVNIVQGKNFNLLVWPSKEVCATTVFNTLREADARNRSMYFSKDSQTAAVFHTDSLSNRIATVAFPLENVQEKSRNLVLKKIIDYLADSK